MLPRRLLLVAPLVVALNLGILYLAVKLIKLAWGD